MSDTQARQPNPEVIVIPDRWMLIHFVLTLLALLALRPARPVHAQVLERMKETVKQSIADRRAATEDQLVLGAAAVTDTLAALGLAPVDSLLGDVAAGAASAITFVASGLAGDGANERTRLAAALDAGRADLADVFLPGTAEPSADGEELLSTIAGLVAERGEPVLLESIAGSDAPPDLADRRVRLGRALLIGYGLPADLLYAVAGGGGAGAAGDGAAIDLRVRPLR